MAGVMQAWCSVVTSVHPSISRIFKFPCKAVIDNCYFYFYSSVLASICYEVMYFSKQYFVVEELNSLILMINFNCYLRRIICQVMHQFQRPPSHFEGQPNTLSINIDCNQTIMIKIYRLKTYYFCLLFKIENYLVKQIFVQLQI